MQRMIALALMAVVLTFGSGCGWIRIPTWINIDPAESVGELEFAGGLLPLHFSGGFYLDLTVNTSNLLSGVTGTISVPVVRMAAVPEPPFDAILGPFCMYADPTAPLEGTLFFDLLTGDSNFGLPLAVEAYSPVLSPSIGAFPFEFPTGGEGAPPIDFQIDTNVLLDAMLFDGDFVGAISIPIEVAAELDVPFFGPSQFDIVLALDSGNVPSDLDAASLDCVPIIHAESGPIPFHVPPRATFLRTNLDPDPRPPVIVDLAQLGAEPGDTLRFTRTGYFSAALNYTMAWADAVFSSSDVILPATGYLNRVPDAIEAGPDNWSPGVPGFPTDIPEDFLVVNPGVDVEVPVGATHLFLGVEDQFYSDNTGTLFTVWIEKL